MGLALLCCVPTTAATTITLPFSTRHFQGPFGDGARWQTRLCVSTAAVPAVALKLLQLGHQLFAGRHQEQTVVEQQLS